MAWRDRLQKAKFRDAEFEVAEAEKGLGRRIALHEYPLKDKPMTEDLGRRARTFTVEAFVIGPDYMDRRDALEKACEQAGPGTLVHPYRGTLSVVLEDARIRESNQYGGMAVFSLAFLESGENINPGASTDHLANVDSVASSAVETFGNVFAEQFNPVGPSFIAATGLSDSLSALGMVSSSVGSIRGAVGSAISDFQAGVNLVRSTVGSVVSLPGQLAGLVTGVIGGLTNDIVDAATTVASTVGWAVSLPLSVVDASLELTRFGEQLSTSVRPSVHGGQLSVLPRTTAMRVRQFNNRAALVSLVRRAAVAEACKAAVRADYDSYDQAAETRDKVAAALDDLITQAGDVGDDDAYRALVKLRAAIVPALADLGTDLARVVSRATPPGPLPALVLAYDLYENVTREAELLGRNAGAIGNPVILPQGEAIEVLSD